MEQGMPLSEELKDLIEQRQLIPTSKGFRGITRVKILVSTGNGPVIMWVSGSFPLPLGRVAGYTFHVWDNNGTLNFRDPDPGPTGTALPDFADLVRKTVLPVWSKIIEAGKAGRIDPTTGHRKSVDVTDILQL